jgi:hypothetical protein
MSAGADSASLHSAGRFLATTAYFYASFALFAFTAFAERGENNQGTENKAFLCWHAAC